MDTQAPPASYQAAHRYDGAAIQHDNRPELVPCAVQPRDVVILRDVWRYKFLTGPQLLELFWEGRAAWAGQRRLLKLFRAGYLERFRPIARQGSYPWTYHLGADGHRLLKGAGLIEPSQRYLRRAIYDFGHVLHELQLNGWVLALRHATREAFIAWEGETDIKPPRGTRHAQLRFEDHWSAEGLKDPRARLLRPDAVVELATRNDEPSSLLFVEYDRTHRVDKNFEKFRRYDAYLTWWWRHTQLADRGERPYVIFVCQNEALRAQFLDAADHELTGHRWHPSAPPQQHLYIGRQQSLFALECDTHAGKPEAWRLPAFPPGHPAREPRIRRVRLTPEEAHPTDMEAALSRAPQRAFIARKSRGRIPPRL